MKKIIIGVSGASGIILAKKLLIKLGDLNIVRHVIISPSAILTLKYELDDEVSSIKNLCEIFYNYKDIAASPSSGSFLHDGMIILPCSVKTFSQIANGITGNLLSRAADVCLKERRKLIIAVREMPLHAGHLTNLANLSHLGAIIAPPMPIFYAKPISLDNLYDDIINKYLDLLGINNPNAFRWEK